MQSVVIWKTTYFLRRRENVWWFLRASSLTCGGLFSSSSSSWAVCSPSISSSSSLSARGSISFSSLTSSSSSSFYIPYVIFHLFHCHSPSRTCSYSREVSQPLKITIIHGDWQYREAWDFLRHNSHTERTTFTITTILLPLIKWWFIWAKCSILRALSLCGKAE